MSSSRIINKYNKILDQFDTKDLAFSFGYAIKDKIQGIIDSIPKSATIAIRGGGMHTKKLLEMIDFSDKNIFAIFDKNKIDDQICGYPVFSASELPHKQVDYVIVSSYIFHKEIAAEVNRLKTNIIDFYSDNDADDFSLTAPFYDFFPTEGVLTHTVMNYFYLRHTSSPSDTAKLYDAMQVAVEMKDFVTFYNIVNHCDQKNDFVITIKAMVDDLLSAMKDEVQKRQQTDIILFLTDAVGYKMLPLMPYLSSISHDGYYFSNSYTSTAFTYQTLRAILRGVLPIDDFDKTEASANESNSLIIQYCLNHNYNFRYIGGEYSGISPKFSEENYGCYPCNLTWWNSMMELLDSDNPVFFIVHFWTETHPPMNSPMLKERLSDLELSLDSYQVKTSYLYMDNCLEMYNKVLGKKTQIYLSDHGDHLDVGDLFWTDRKLHTYCFVIGEKIEQKTFDGMFLYLDFHKLLSHLIEPDKHSIEDIFSDIVTFQDVDIYGSDLIKWLTEHDQLNKVFSYRGARNAKYKYVINSLGKEWFYSYEKDGTEKKIAEINEDNLNMLKAAAGNQFLDVFEINKFVNTRRIYNMLSNKEQIDDEAK